MTVNCKRLLFDPKLFWTLATLVIVGDVVLTQLIIRFVPFTEIDWETYMHQVKIYLDGERDYDAISGPTGLLVYPAGHVYIHAFLYRLTDAGRNLALSQQVYTLLYVASLVISCAIYRQVGGVPNWVVLLLSLSKRLHSIYVLRLFNDVWAVILTQLSILALGHGLFDVAILLFSAALSVKMSVLLYLPAFLVVLVKGRGLATTVRLCFTIISVQGLLGYPFLLKHPLPYVKGAFDFGRVFLYKWTVNWRFLSEDRFLDPKFATALLVGHASVLVAFGLFRWCRSAGGAIAVLNRAIRRPNRPGSRVPVTADEAITIAITSNLVGILFARSLHYQFYSWYAYQVPLLTWRTRYPTALKLVIVGAIEYGWNVYPSTRLSSAVLCASHVALLGGIWFGYPEGRT
ncbi:mannosyltransferase [Lactarius akahatsu]|uniref:Dol-P-Man:Man(5)GlcNAc(2)-PP-Dol alpha-1,3-mannosyltransferase n=1 Tax=Lactarius akahatsu TaxID=416441 RepID=A0AAD4QI55_9AGAM|nr:mannosyltransferase [Lactarius akahatsu]